MQRPWVTSAAYDAAISAVVDARKATGISQRELADRLGKPRSFVSKIENKERRIDVVEAVVIARALGLTPERLISQIAAALPEQIDF